MFLVLLIIVIITISVSIYFFSSLVGEPIEVRTFAEYRWANYMPSAALFYLTYHNESWEALKDIALSHSEQEIWTEEEFFDEFRDEYNLLRLQSYINNLNVGLWNKDRQYHTVFIKDRQGLIISFGLPKEYIVKEGFSTFPDEYPYNCYTKNTPVYTNTGETNKRIEFALCCYDIKNCDDYITGAGRRECKRDVCGVSPTGCQDYFCTSADELEECEGREKEWICKKSVCGDGLKGVYEECDDGNNDNTDSCLESCVNAKCGDGYVWEGKEECDDGKHCADGTPCTNSDECKGIGDEICKPRSGDGCSADCMIET